MTIPMWVAGWSLGLVAQIVAGAPAGTPAGAPAIPITQSEMRARLVEAEPPAYPKIALAATVQGPVVMDVTVGADGSVASVSALWGALMLRGAAVSGVRRWRFEPAAGDTRTVAIVMFRSSDGAVGMVEALDPIGDTLARCLATAEAGQHEDAIDLCAEAEATASTLIPAGPGLPIIPASLLAQGLVDAGRYAEALEKVDEYERVRVTDTDRSPGILRAAKARALVGLGRSEDAHKAFEDARKQLNWFRDRTQSGSVEREEAVQLMRPVMRDHADLLVALGRQRDADRLRQQADELR